MTNPLPPNSRKKSIVYLLSQLSLAAMLLYMIKSELFRCYLYG